MSSAGNFGHNPKSIKERIVDIVPVRNLKTLQSIRTPPPANTVPTSKRPPLYLQMNVTKSPNNIHSYSNQGSSPFSSILPSNRQISTILSTRSVQRTVNFAVPQSLNYSETPAVQNCEEVSDVEDPNSCSSCRKQFGCPSDVKQHKMLLYLLGDQAHRFAPYENDAYVPIDCPVCFQRIQTTDRAIDHMTECALSNKRTVWRCKRCHRRFQNYGDLVAHAKLTQRECQKPVTSDERSKTIPKSPMVITVPKISTIRPPSPLETVETDQSRPLEIEEEGPPVLEKQKPSEESPKFDGSKINKIRIISKDKVINIRVRKQKDAAESAKPQPKVIGKQVLQRRRIQLMRLIKERDEKLKRKDLKFKQKTYNPKYGKGLAFVKKKPKRFSQTFNSLITDAKAQKETVEKKRKRRRKSLGLEEEEEEKKSAENTTKTSSAASIAATVASVASPPTTTATDGLFPPRCTHGPNMLKRKSCQTCKTIQQRIVEIF